MLHRRGSLPLVKSPYLHHADVMLLVGGEHAHQAVGALLRWQQDAFNYFARCGIELSDSLEVIDQVVVFALFLLSALLFSLPSFPTLVPLWRRHLLFL